MFKIIYYRNKCIGCSICFELQPELWRMSKKDGKATLLKSTAKKDMCVLSVSNTIQLRTRDVVMACPVKIIKVL